MGKEEGFVKIYRSLIDDPIWLNSTPAQKAVLITLMCMVTWKPRKWDVLGKPITLKPGQCFTSLSEIALRAGDGVSREVVRKALARFETLGFSTHQRTQRGTLITIVKWRVYQLEEEAENIGWSPGRHRGGRRQKGLSRSTSESWTNGQPVTMPRRSPSSKRPYL